MMAMPEYADGASSSPLQRTPLRLSIVLHEADALGAGIAVARVIPALQDLGWQISVVLPEGGPLANLLSDTDMLIADPPRPFGLSLAGWRRPPGVRKRMYRSWGYFRSIRSALLQQQPDVVHINSLHALPEGLVARHLSLPIVVHVHEIPPPSTKRSLTVRGAVAVADVVVPVANPVKAMFASVASRSHLMTVYNGVALRPHAKDHVPLIVGTVGSVCERKGTDIFMQAVRIIRAKRDYVNFEHIGPSGLSNDRAFDAKVADMMDATEGLTFLGAGDVNSALSRWSIFVLPSRQEAFPLATLEAMSSGLPVIASDVGGLSEQIVDGETGTLIPAEDPTALAAAIMDLLDDPARRRRLGNAARRRVAEFFTYQRQAEGLHKAYLYALCHRGRFRTLTAAASTSPLV
ncbi:MAG TPA: glycosyltransferase family 4 protein [Solirubrobacteraceae bacterium]|jgi:glycosyltransferase involved in cell wall biosynthesis|nr:glycosyltransferase family 4 protein [Solirubrobacteraceae bacterium]